jgi:hypothetical protein
MRHRVTEKPLMHVIVRLPTLRFVLVPVSVSVPVEVFDAVSPVVRVRVVVMNTRPRLSTLRDIVNNRLRSVSRNMYAHAATCSAATLCFTPHRLRPDLTPSPM